MNPSTAVVLSELADCERVIERGMSSFIEVGNALARIQEGKLYDGIHPTFEDYCRDRWGMSRPRAYQLIDSARISACLPMVDNERVARELVPIKDDPDLLREVWQAVVDTGEKPTAALIHHAMYPPEDREEAPTENDNAWEQAIALINALRDAKRVAASVPQRRKAATAKQLRKLGMYLAQVAYELENAYISEELNQ